MGISVIHVRVWRESRCDFLFITSDMVAMIKLWDFRGVAVRFTRK